ncbi:MAG: hypothetical protein LH628_25595 [Microcoleus sp. CAN_BIN18]|nr:hypothetical protein [Microcoleus sp. CAN_BIN18]
MKLYLRRWLRVMLRKSWNLCQNDRSWAIAPVNEIDPVDKIKLVRWV